MRLSTTANRQTPPTNPALDSTAGRQSTTVVSAEPRSSISGTVHPVSRRPVTCPSTDTHVFPCVSLPPPTTVTTCRQGYAMHCSPHLSSLAHPGGKEPERLFTQEQALGSVFIGARIRGLWVHAHRGQLDGKAASLPLGLGSADHSSRSLHSS